jgi:DNA-binding CsgD family transcriptional regulator
MKSLSTPKGENSAYGAAISERELRFSAFVENAAEGIWRIDFEPPISLDAPEMDQVRHIVDRGVFTEANNAAAHIYGLATGDEVVGQPLADFMPLSVAGNMKMLTRLVYSRFYMKNLLSFEQGANGKTLTAVNTITPHIVNGKVLHIWGSSLDITDSLAFEKELDETKHELILKTQALEEKNAALKELITHIEIDRKEFKDRLIANIDQVVLPLLDKIRLSHTDGTQIAALRQALQDLTSSFGLKLANRGVNLTPREIEVCALVKMGFSSKEIARKLKIALHTVEKHRRTARKKMGLTRKGINLQTYLSSL